MLMQMIDCLIEQDPSLSARRTIDMRRYIVNRWNRTHEEPIEFHPWQNDTRNRLVHDLFLHY